MKIFKDRQSAGKLLAKRLKDTNADLVLGIPRGGVVVAKEVAKALNLPLDIIVTRKIGAPFQPELALGAVDSDGLVVWNKELLAGLKQDSKNLKREVQKEVSEIKRREQILRSGKKVLNVEGKNIILVDDGIATGATTLAAINYLKRHRAIVSLAIPVVPKDTLEKLQKEVDNMIVLETPEYFQAVGQFYQDFPQVSDEEVVKYLE